MPGSPRGAAGQRHDRQARASAGFTIADRARQRVPVQQGHAAIGQQQVVAVVGECIQGLLAILDQRGGMAQVAELAGDDGAIDRVVFRHEDARAWVPCARGGSRGSAPATRRDGL